MNKQQKIINKEEQYLFEIIKNYFHNSPIPPLQPIRLPQLLKIIKETTMDGVSYKVFEHKKVSQEFLFELKKGYEAIKQLDVLQKKTLRALEKVSATPILIKEAQFKVNNTYEPGTRFSCDVDIAVQESKENVDFELIKQEFMIHEIDVIWKKELLEKSAQANKNVQLLPIVYEEQLQITKHKKIRTGYVQVVSRIKLFMTVNKITYFHKKGAMLDAHFQLGLPGVLFNMPFEHIQVIKKNKHTTISSEDALLVNAGHFIWNLRKKGNWYQGFLKYLTDVEFVLQEKEINWHRVIYQAKKFGCSSLVWFYLHLAKKHLHSNIPSAVLKKLKQDGSFVQNRILEKISGHNILFNKKDRFAQLFTYLYLSSNISQKILHQAHTIVAKLQQRLR